MSELQKAVADLIIKATQAAEAAGKFAVEQLPDVAQQYVLYIGIISSISVIASLGLILIPFWAYKWAFKHSGGSFGDAIFSASLIAIPCWVIGGICLVNSFDKAVLAFFAPKILLIQWTADLIK